ncbi:hypothetical protein R3P38DRAFT_2796182 [Favolaschia claudopus]|uniref:Uncharacterized protein n=1 Tax=Favolaschia claudopus TaxID=2862362 RepID=A0AAW0A4J7_9AGAR
MSTQQPPRLVLRSPIPPPPSPHPLAPPTLAGASAEPTPNLDSPSGGLAPPASDTPLTDTTNTPRPVETTLVAKPAPKPAFKVCALQPMQAATNNPFFDPQNANLFGFGPPRPSRIPASSSKLDSLAALATTAAPEMAAATQITENAQNSQGVGGSSSATPSDASNKEKAAKRTKNPDALLKANQTSSARSLQCSLLV